MKRFFTLSIVLAHIVCVAQPTNWPSTGIGGGGALFSPSINPANHNEIYMGCDMTELFHTTDGGATWGQANFLQIQGGHDSKVQFTEDPNILYTVDYTSTAGSDYIRAKKSTDAGQTWNNMAGDPFAGAPTILMRVLADPHNHLHVIIADYSTMYFSADGGVTSHLIHTAYYNGAGCHIAGSYFDGNNIYIATNDGLIYSTNGGTSFSVKTTTGIPAVQKMLSFAGGKQNGTTRFYCLTGDSGNVYAGITYGNNYHGTLASVYSMDDTSGTWTAKMTGITLGTDYLMLVGMAENCIDTAYLAGGTSSSSPTVMKTVNGGSNWTHVFLTANNQNIYTGWAGQGGDHAWSFPEAPFGFTVAGNDAQTLMFTDFSCAHISHDGGANWHQQYLSPTDENPKNVATPVGKTYHGIGMENTTNWNVMWTDSTHVFASFSDIGGIMSSDKGASWKFMPFNYNSIYHVVQHTNGTIYAATSSIHDMYQTTRLTNLVLDGGNGKIYYSSNGGTSFSILHDFTHPVIWMALDPTDSNRMYASVINSSTGGIYVTNNLNLGASSTWTHVTNPPRTLGHPLVVTVLNDGAVVASFSATKSNSGSTFSQSSGVFYSTDSGTTWADRTDAHMKYYTKDVTIDPTDTSQNTWYASVFAGWGTANGQGNGLYKTTDRGQHWTQISNEYRVNSCAVNPNNKDEMYYTTETNGLWYTSNLTAPTPTFTRVAGYPFRSPVRVTYNPWNNGQVWISSFGNGIRYSSTTAAASNVYSTLYANFCQGQSYLGHDTTGIYVDSFPLGNGADSIRTLHLTINPLPAVPTISMQGDTLTASAATYYQWYIDSSPLNGDTAQQLIVTQSGHYYVVVTNDYGCSNTSAVDTVTISGITEPGNDKGLRIFPDPSAGIVNLLWNTPESGTTTICIFDLTGRMLKHIIVPQNPGINTMTLDLSGYNAGIYLVKLKSGSATLWGKVMLQ